MRAIEHVEELRALDGALMASVSGGKDSTALALALRAAGVRFTPVFADTGWESAHTYAYLDRLEQALDQPIVRVAHFPTLTPAAEAVACEIEAMPGLRRKSAMVRWCLYKAMFPSRMMRWCTQVLKAIPLDAWARENEIDAQAIGVRREESRARADVASREDVPDRDMTIYRPLAAWSERDVIDAHLECGIEPNPLYIASNASIRRVGCWPCVQARKSDLRSLGELDSARVAVIEAMESAVWAQVQLREHKHESPPSFFQAKTGGGGECWPIARVLQWAARPDQGRQFELFADGETSGCARWGLCAPLEFNQ